MARNPYAREKMVQNNSYLQNGGFINTEYAKLLSLKERSKSVQPLIKDRISDKGKYINIMQNGRIAGKPSYNNDIQKMLNNNVKRFKNYGTMNKVWFIKPISNFINIAVLIEWTGATSSINFNHKSLDKKNQSFDNSANHTIHINTQFETPKTDLPWKDFLEIQNQYKELVSEDYRNRDKRLRDMNGKYLRQQIRQNDKVKQNELSDKNIDDWDTTVYNNFGMIFVYKIKMNLAQSSPFKPSDPEWDDP